MFCSLAFCTQHRHTYLEEAPVWLLCPGAPAAVFKRCSTIANGQDSECRRTPGCAVQKSSDGRNSCTAAVLLNKTRVEQNAWFDRFRALDPSVVGSCESVCYLKAVFSCAGYNSMEGSGRGSTKAAAEAACRENVGCSWSGANSWCTANLFGSDAWGQAAAQAMGSCSALSKDKYTCAGGSLNGTLQPGRIKRYKDYEQPASGSGTCAY